MKKILLSVVAVTAIAIGYQKYNQSKTMSDLMLANVEALAGNESSNDNCQADKDKWCEFVVSTPSGSWVESHPDMSVKL